MKAENVIIEKLNELYHKRGYVSEEEILELCDEHSLSFLMTDHVISSLTDMGVLIADAPNDTKDNDYYDYSQIDYEQVYLFFENLYPDMRPTIDYIRAIPPIQKGETKSLISQIRSGNEYARKVLTEKCFRTALRITMSYQEKSSVPLEDLFMISYDGIVEAIDSYDPYSGSHFTSYVSLWIKQKIDRYICDNESLIRLPVHMFEQISNVKSVIDNEYGSGKSLIAAIASNMEITDDKARELLPNGRYVSLDDSKTSIVHGFIKGSKRRKYNEGYQSGMDVPDYSFTFAERSCCIEIMGSNGSNFEKFRIMFIPFTTRPIRMGVRVSPADRSTVPSRMEEVLNSIGR